MPPFSTLPKPVQGGRSALQAASAALPRRFLAGERGRESAPAAADDAPFSVQEQSNSSRVFVLYQVPSSSFHCHNRNRLVAGEVLQRFGKFVCICRERRTLFS